tara:strand:- start:5966 stop:7126 length:1161 start_codon:yes stop_codon:yes gene_type:complete
VAANGWAIFGLGLGQILYWVILLLGVKILSKTVYRQVGVLLLLLTISLKLINIIFNTTFTGFMSEFPPGLIFVLVGATIYAKNPIVIYRQLIYFFALSIPFMILQKIGVHTFFYGWNTELFHENFNYSFDEVKDLGVIFKNIPLFPTLFVEFNDLTYAMYQGRPTGLLYSNNVLSVIISIAVALHFTISHSIKIKFKNIIIALIIVLTMSTLVYGVLFLLFIYFYFVHGDKNMKRNALKTVFLTLAMIFTHYLFFPGLTISSFGLVNAISFVSRFADIFNALGINYFDEFIILYNLKFDSEESVSLIGSILKNNFLYLILIFSLVIIKVYYKHLKNHKESTVVYVTLLVVCLLTQFGVNFIKAPSFQLFLGIALFPIFKSKILSLK